MDHTGQLGLGDHDVLCRTPSRATADVPGMCPSDIDAVLRRRSAPYGVSRPVGRVLCARLRGAAVIHLGLPLPAASCGLPASIGRAALDRSRREPLAPLLTLLRVGFTEPPQSPAALVVSYTTVSPLPRLTPGRSVFCGTVPRVTPGRRYRPPCPMEPGPSSPSLRPARPPGRLTRASGYAGCHRARIANRTRARARGYRVDAVPMPLGLNAAKRVCLR